MKTSLKICIVFVIFLTSFTIQVQYFKSISSQITNTFIPIKFRKNNLFERARNAVHKKNAFLQKLSNDTVYIIEDSDLGQIRGRIWTNNQNISYEYTSTKKGYILHFPKAEIFSQRQIDLISQWDSCRIRSEESSKANYHLERLLYAYRAVRLKNKIAVEQIKFHDFFDPKIGN